MANRPASPRIEPLAPAEQSAEQRELLAASMLPDANVFRTFVGAPGLYRKWLPFAGKLLAGKIPGRDRELLILRTGFNCLSDYEWAQHTIIGRREGLSETEIGRVAQKNVVGWDDFDAALIRAADELHEDSCISDSTWEILSQNYDTQQMIEVPMLVGHYHLVAMTLNSLGVALDPGLEGFPAD